MEVGMCLVPWCWHKTGYVLSALMIVWKWVHVERSDNVTIGSIITVKFHDNIVIVVSVTICIVIIDSHWCHYCHSQHH